MTALPNRTDEMVSGPSSRDERPSSADPLLVEYRPRTPLKSQANVWLAKTVTTFYRRMLFLVYPLQRRQIPTFRTTLSLDFSVLTTELKEYHEFRPDTPVAEIRDRMDRGDRCFASWHGGRIVDAGWVATGAVRVRYLERHMLLSHGDIYHYDSFTLPEFRGRGPFMARNSYVARCNQSEGFVRSVALVALENRASWRVLNRAGLETRGSYSYLRLGPFSRYEQHSDCGEELPPLVRANAMLFPERLAELRPSSR
ncbi:MAG: hypothetical protein H7Z74_11595 [Anaerolineae bacterium]|nr:hypothetical protein [Gemmatimonadaceae bacterium]